MVENLIELGVNLVEALIIVDFLTKFFGLRENSSTTRWSFYGILIIFFLEISLMNFLTPFEGVAVVIYILTLEVYCQNFLNGKTAVKLLMCTFVIAIVHLISISTILLISHFRDLKTLDLINILSTERIMLIITTKLLLFYITRLILKLKINANLSIIEGMLLLGMPLASIVSMSFMMSTALLHSDIRIEVILSMLSVLFTNILVYCLFMKISNDNEEKLKNELITQNYEDERKNAENIKAMSNKMLGLKHDLKNHFTTLKLYLEEEKYQEAEGYIDNLMEKKLEGIIPLVRTGNNALNAILNSK